MTISNVIAGFRVTGIYPLDREAVLGPISDLSALSEETRLSFIPMISPAVRHFTSRTSRRDVTPDSEAREQDFSDRELALFEYWYDEGHDITDNDRYNTWLAQSHPTSPAASHVWMWPLQSTGISHMSRIVQWYIGNPKMLSFGISICQVSHSALSVMSYCPSHSTVSHATVSHLV